MIFDVQIILKTDGARVPVQGNLALPADFQDLEMQFSDSVQFFGFMENIGGVLELTGEAKGDFTVPCARCTKTVKQSFCVSVSETLAHVDAEVADKDEVVPFSGNEVNLSDVVWPDILLGLGTKYLCKPDCKGLCPMCGTDLNEATCSCEKDEIDPRLAGLKDLLK